MTERNTISLEYYDDFCQRYAQLQAKNLSIFTDISLCQDIARTCKELFSVEIMKISALLNDSNIGIAAIDIPENYRLEKAEDTVLGAAVVMGIFNNIGKSNIDPVNATPFTLHTASHSSGKLLQSAEHTPESKLGYHNDGLINGDHLEVPETIVLYNLYIGYRKPGYFWWVPTAAWNEAEYFFKKQSEHNLKIKIKLTPYFNLTKDKELKKSEFDHIEIPLCINDEMGLKRFFLNGQLLPELNTSENLHIVALMRKSLENNQMKIGLEQKERRAFFFKNTEGFHARDIFENPIEGIDLTRVFLRSVDVNSKIYPSNKISVEEITLR